MADLLCHTLKHLATYDVQDAEICGESGNIFIKCVFASGSQARGCHVEIRHGSMNITRNITVLRNDSSLSHTAEDTVNGLVSGSYEVFIFDLERDGVVTSTPSYVSYANVTGFLTLNTSEVDNSSALPTPTTVTKPDPSPTTGRRTMIVATAVKQIDTRHLHLRLSL